MVVFVLKNVLDKISKICGPLGTLHNSVKLNRIRKTTGAILIEFAFALPVFLVLLYYIHDLPRLRLMQRKMQFVAYEMSAIIQNIAKQKSVNEEVITKKDFADAMKLAYLSIYTGNTINGTIEPSSKFPYGHYPLTAAIYVRGTGDNKAEGKWKLRSFGGNGINAYRTNSNLGGAISLNYQTETTNALTFYPKLSISQGENKIILQCVLYYDHAGKFKETFSDGTLCKNVSVRDAFGFLLFKPEGVGTDKTGFFPAEVIFSIGSHFPETEPK